MKLKLHYSSWLLAIVLSLCSVLTTYAETVTTVIDNIKYNLDTVVKTAEVSSNDNSYSGDIVIPGNVTYDGVTYKVTALGFECFYNCRSLTSVTLPEGVTTLQTWCFSHCVNLKSVTLPDGLTTLAHGCFYDCRNLTSIVLPNTVTWLGPMCFSRCYSLTDIILPDGITEIGQSCFGDCSSLANITLPAGITELGSSCFGGCSSLTSITLPDGITRLGSSCFNGCSSLKSMYVSRKTPFAVYDYIFEGFDKSLCTLYVPTEAVDNYRQADVWKDFMNIKEYNPTGTNNALDNGNVMEASRYSTNGQIMNAPAKGMNIVKYSNGSVKKILVP